MYLRLAIKPSSTRPLVTHGDHLVAPVLRPGPSSVVSASVIVSAFVIVFAKHQRLRRCRRFISILLYQRGVPIFISLNSVVIKALLFPFVEALT